MGKAVVLVSGGLDSTVLLASIVKILGKENVTALNVFYGQKHKKEAEYAQYQVDKYGVELISIDLTTMYKFDAHCTLLEGGDDLPTGDYKEQMKENEIVSTYVPFRNGLFLSVAAAIAIQLEASCIFYGAHSDDAGVFAYPDCSEDFIGSMKEAIYTGSGSKVSLIAPFQYMKKKDVVEAGKALEVDFEHTWSCYEGKDVPCGVCATCIDRARAFEENGWTDPSIQKQEV